MLGAFSCGLISHSPKCSSCFKLLISGWRPNKPLSHGWEGGVSWSTNMTLQPGQVLGAGCSTGAKKGGFLCQWTLLGHCGESMAHSPTRWAPTTSFAQGTFTACRAPCCSSHPQSHHEDNTQSLCHPQQDLSLHGDTVLMGQDTAKPSPEHILAAPDPGSGCMLSQETETWAPAAAASHVPNERCFSPFHYTGFLIKTERAFFSENEPQGPNQ